MKFCDADACSSCDLAEGEPDCLRRKAEFCFQLTLRFPKTGLRAALEKIGLNLIKDSEALERERAVLAHSR